jgi:large repetitive protein
VVTPLDVLVAINELNQNGPRQLPVPVQPPLAPPPYYDVSGDDWLTPLDALLVINYINEHGPGPIPVATSAASPIIPDSLADRVWAEGESLPDPVPPNETGYTPRWLDPWPANAEADSPVSVRDTRPHRGSARWEPFEDLLTLLAERLPDG